MSRRSGQSFKSGELSIAIDEGLKMVSLLKALVFTVRHLLATDTWRTRHAPRVRTAASLWTCNSWIGTLLLTGCTIHM